MGNWARRIFYNNNIKYTYKISNSSKLFTYSSRGYDSMCLEEGVQVWGNTSLLTNHSARHGPPSCPQVYYDDDVFQATVVSEVD